MWSPLGGRAQNGSAGVASAPRAWAPCATRTHDISGWATAPSGAPRVKRALRLAVDPGAAVARNWPVSSGSLGPFVSDTNRVQRYTRLCAANESHISAKRWRSRRGFSIVTLSAHVTRCQHISSMPPASNWTVSEPSSLGSVVWPGWNTKSRGIPGGAGGRTGGRPRRAPPGRFRTSASRSAPGRSPGPARRSRR